MVRALLLLQNQSGCLKSVRLPRLHAAEEAGARGGQALVCGIHNGQAVWWQGEGEGRRHSLCSSGGKREECSRPSKQGPFSILTARPWEGGQMPPSPPASS